MTTTRARLLIAALTTLILACAPAAAQAASTCAAQNVTVTPLQSNVFYVDTTSSYLGSYVGYKVANTGGAPRAGLWMQLESFTGGVVAPADGGATTRPLPVATLAAGAAAPTYAYIKATGATATVQRHDVVIYSGRPGSGGTEVCRETQTQSSVQQVIKASANKVTSASVSTTTATLGGSFALTVEGSSGTIGAGIASDPGVVRFSPAVAASWPSSAFRLVGVSHQLPLGGAPIADLLSRSNMSGASQDYSVTYTFRVVGATSAATPVVPVSNIASGTQIKHTDPGSFSSLAPIPQVTSDATMSVAAVGSGPYASGATVPLSAAIVNAGSAPITVDQVDLRLPATWSAVGGSFTRDGTALPDAYDAGGGLLRLVGPFTVAANSTSTFGLDAAAGTPGTSGSFTALATLDGAQIDGTNDPGDDKPAATTLTVLGPPVANPDVVSAAVATPRDIDVLANDQTTGTASLAITSAPEHGTASVVGDHVRYESDGGYTGPDTITYEVTTPGGTASATVTIDVQPLPAPPVAPDVTSAGVGTAPQHQDLAIPNGGAVALRDGGGDPATSVTITGQGSYALDTGTGRVTFTPVLGFAGTADAVTYAATDAFGQTTTGLYTPDVTPPVAPAPADVTSSGTGTATQGRTLALPAGGRVRLLDADGHEAVSVTVPGEGVYALDVSDGHVVFTPQLGFAGTGAVAYRATDAYNQHGDAVYRPTVTAPAGPAAPARTSSGVGTTPQTRDLPIPDGGGVRLLDGATPVTAITVAGQGQYALDAATGVVTFTPAYGFAGTATPVAYRATDAYNQHADGTYTPTVTPPSQPTPPPLASTGTGTAPQQPAAITVPVGGRVRLLDAGGNPVTSVTIPGQGTYTLDTATGTITFAPLLGFAGTATPVAYRVTDAYNQAKDATYTPSVTPPPAPAAPAQSSTGTVAQAQAEKVPVPQGGTAMLIGADGQPRTRIDIEGVGTYAIEPATGVVTFTPLATFSGTPPAVHYRVTDAYGQATDGTYAPTVTAAAAVTVATPPATTAARVLPVATPCVSRRTTRIHWKVAAGAHVRRIAITLNGKAYKSLRGDARQALIDLHGRPAETVTVRVTARGARTLSTQRTYRTCTSRLVGKPLPTLRLR